MEQFRLIPPFNRAIDLATNSNVHESFAMPRQWARNSRFRIFAPFCEYDKNWDMGIKSGITNWGKIFEACSFVNFNDNGRLRWLDTVSINYPFIEQSNSNVHESFAMERGWLVDPGVSNFRSILVVGTIFRNCVTLDKNWSQYLKAIGDD